MVTFLNNTSPSSLFHLNNLFNLLRIHIKIDHSSNIFLIILFSGIFSITAQDPISNDSITQLDEVILLDALKTKNATGITQSEVLGAKVFQNYSPVSMVNAINQISGVYVLSGALNTNRITMQ